MYKYPLSSANIYAYRPSRLSNRVDDTERFSSFETPPPSDRDNEEFSDYSTSREKNYRRILGQYSIKRQRNQVVVGQLPLQLERSNSSRKKQNPNSYADHLCSDLKTQKYDKKVSSSAKKQSESPQLKQNCPLRYNYMQNFQKHLSTIKQDAKQQIRDSAFTSINPPRSLPVSKFIATDPFDHYDRLYGQKIYYQSNQSIFEKQNLEMLILQQQNISLKERLLLLQRELRVRDEEKARRQSEIMAQRMGRISQDQHMSSTRKEVKQKLIEEVSILQTRCKQMKEEMKLYKQRQEQTFSKIIKEKQDVKIENIMLKTNNQYQVKFTEVFLNMAEKLPIQLQAKWSKKRKIAVGWKVVKHLVKKALKLGIHLPAISQKQQIN